MILIREWALRWRHNVDDGVYITGVSIVYQPFVQTQIKENAKLRVTGIREGNSPMTGEFPAQRSSNAENVSIWWRHYGDLPMIFTSDAHRKYLNLANRLTSDQNCFSLRYFLHAHMCFNTRIEENLHQWLIAPLSIRTVWDDILTPLYIDPGVNISYDILTPGSIYRNDILTPPHDILTPLPIVHKTVLLVMTNCWMWCIAIFT